MARRLQMELFAAWHVARRFCCIVILVAASVVLVVVVDVQAFDNIALKAAAAAGSVKAVQGILDLGGDIHAGNDRALCIATYEGNVDLVKFLLKRGANVHARNDVVVYLAIESGDPEMLGLIIDSTQANRTCGPGWTSKRRVWFSAARRSKRREMLEVLNKELLPATAECTEY